jgi:hypothetical protein
MVEIITGIVVSFEELVFIIVDNEDLKTELFDQLNIDKKDYKKIFKSKDKIEVFFKFLKEFRNSKDYRFFNFYIDKYPKLKIFFKVCIMEVLNNIDLNSLIITNLGNDNFIIGDSY